MMHPLIENAYKVLRGEALSKEEALTLSREINGGDLLDLLSLAHKVQQKYAPGVHSCSIINAKSGKCSEDCRFCAQSGCHSTDIATYPLLSPQEALAAARKVYDAGIRTFGYVTSGRGWQRPDHDFMTILETLDLIHAELPDMYLCVSLGILSEECVRLLSAHHARRYNMNLQTAPAAYSSLVASSHAVEEKIETIRLMKKYGIANCTGGIFGLGESWKERIDLAFAVRELNVEGAPLNILLAIPGTPLEGQKPLAPAEAAKSFALFRLINPMKMLKFCAGRETVMKDFQGLLMLSGLNGLMTGGYLTTRGRDIAADQEFSRQLSDF